jgi:pyruvate, water dikinase
MNHGYVIGLDQIGKDDIKIAGGKGANLGQMIKFGIPVPSGFVVTTSSFDTLIQINNLENQIDQIIKNTDVDNTTELLKASKTIKKIIISCRMPFEIESKIIESYKNLSEKDHEYDTDVNYPNKRDILCAIRSSATAEDLPTASFAGQQASFLNVNGREELIESVKKCWASLFEPRAIFYRSKHGFSKASIAVIVQKMVNAQKSGIMFTIDPTTGDDTILIESTWGLGESIVGGEVEPDSYKVSKAELEKGARQEAIMEVKISQKTKMRFYDYTLNTNVEVNVPENKANAQVLTKDEILKLAEYGIMIEKYYRDQPQDIEFAIDEKGRITFVQTRAITTKAKEMIEKIDTSHNGKKKLLQGTGASPGIVSGKIKLILRKDDITKIENGDIIVTTMTSPDLVPGMSKSAAIITDLGGRTCHAAIVSREMGIPAIVGTKIATRILRDAQEVTVDAYNGVVYEGKLKLIKEQEQFEEKKFNAKIPFMPITNTKVKVNIAFVGHGVEQIASKADGVGLLRIEHLITMYGIHPAKLVKEGKQEQYIKILMDGIRPIAKAFNPKSVWVRMLDARTDEFRNLEGGEDEPVEANPMLGWHGIRRSLDEQELLKSEFQAIKRLHEEGLTNLQVMLPFVISVEEVRKAKEIAKQVSLPLDKAKIGIMVETPASVMIIEDLCKEGIAFVSFGTNDLTQLILGIDRNNERLAQLSSEFHPAVLRSMEMVINICNRYGIETSICGESGSNASMVRILMKYGIKSISCNIDAIDTIREVIYQEEQQQNISQK